MFASFLKAARRNWQILMVSILLLAFIVSLGVIFSVRGSGLMADQLRDKLRSTAAAAAMQFDPAVIEKIHDKSAMTTPAFIDVVSRLHMIREEIPSIRFAYIMRRTADPMTLQFVADADSLATPAQLDRNGDGIIQPDEQASYPGDSYDISGVPTLQGPAFDGPSADTDFTVDQWGTLISGYAPIRDKSGHAVAIVGLDMDAGQYLALSDSVFSPVAFLLLCLSGFVLAILVGGFLWRRQVDALRRIDRERSGLLLLAMHQIGSPLTILRWSLEELTDQRGTPGFEHALDGHLKNVREAGNQLGGILDELREASDIDAGTIPYNSEWVSMRAVIDGVVSQLRPALDARRQTVTVSSDPAVQLSLDTNLIAGVLRELVQNAMTFSPEGSTIAVTAMRTGRTLIVEVIDHGCGINKGDLPHVFDKFTRGAKAHLYQPNGNGLGLYIAKGIIERAGGKIRIDTKDGEGTTVRFTLPC